MHSGWGDPSRLESPVWPAKQITQRLASEQGDPTPATVLGPVVDHVAALTERGEIGVRVVGGVVVAVSRGQHHPGPTQVPENVGGPGHDAHPSATPVTPRGGRRVPPAAIAEVDHGLPVWSPTTLASAPGAPEPDRDRELRPVNRVEEAMLAPDRHGVVRRSDLKRERRTAWTGRPGLRCARPSGQPR